VHSRRTYTVPEERIEFAPAHRVNKRTNGQVHIHPQVASVVSGKLRLRFVTHRRASSLRRLREDRESVLRMRIRLARLIESLPLPIFAVKEIANCSTPVCVHFALSFALFGAQAILVVRLRLHCFRRTALRTSIGESGLIWPQFEFFTAIDTGSDWECHETNDKTGCAFETTTTDFVRKGEPAQLLETIGPLLANHPEQA
jgi:hypothetical protein